MTLKKVLNTLLRFYTKVSDLRLQIVLVTITLDPVLCFWEYVLGRLTYLLRFFLLRHRLLTMLTSVIAAAAAAVSADFPSPMVVLLISARA